MEALKEVALALSSLLEVIRRPTAPCESKALQKMQKKTRGSGIVSEYGWEGSKEADRVRINLARAVASYTGAMNEVTRGSTYTVEP